MCEQNGTKEKEKENGHSFPVCGLQAMSFSSLISYRQEYHLLFVNVLLPQYR